MSRVVSHHLFRRRARQKAHELTETARWHPGGGGVPTFRVERATRGPARWWVVRL